MILVMCGHFFFLKQVVLVNAKCLKWEYVFGKHQIETG